MVEHILISSNKKKVFERLLKKRVMIEFFNKICDDLVIR